MMYGRNALPGARAPWNLSWWVPGRGINGTRRAIKLCGLSVIEETPLRQGLVKANRTRPSAVHCRRS